MSRSPKKISLMSFLKKDRKSQIILILTNAIYIITVAWNDVGLKYEHS